MRSLFLLCVFAIISYVGNAQSFSVAVSPSSQTVTVAETATYSIDITPLNGFDATVFLTATSANKFMGSVTLSATAPNPPYKNVTLQIRPAIQDTGLRTFTIVAKNGTEQSTATITLATLKNFQWTTVKPPSSVRWYTKVNLKRDMAGDICFATYYDDIQNSENMSVHHYRNQHWETESFNTSIKDNELRHEGVVFNYDNKGVFWFGTPNGLGKYDGKYTSLFNTLNSDFPYNYVLSVQTNKNGHPICLTSDRRSDSWRKAFVYYDGSVWKSIINPKSTSSNQIDWMSSFCIDSSNRILIPTNNVGVLRIQDTTQEFISAKGQGTNTIFSNYVSQIICDKDGETWYMHHSKLQFAFSHFDGTTWQYISSPTQTILYTFLLDDNKNIWAGSEEGLHRYDGTSWTTYNKSNSPLPGEVQNIVQDINKNIWMYYKEAFYIFNPAGVIGIPIAPLGIEEQPVILDKIQIFPNPTSSGFTISGADGSSSLSITNSLGIEVLSQQSKVGNAQIDVSSLQNGLYFVCIRTATGAVVKPLVINR